MVRQNLSGRKFHRLTVLYRTVGRSGWWDCRCDCGGTTSVSTGNLNRGTTKSCGCAVDGSWSKTHGMYGTAEYEAWSSAIDRCRNTKNSKYPIYGGRGIRMCDEWQKSFQAFFDELGPRPSPGHSLDRIDGNKGYQPGNCRWATLSEQNSNRRNGRRWIVFGVEYPSGPSAAAAHGVTAQTISEWCLGRKVKGVRRPPRPGCSAPPLYEDNCLQEIS